MIVPIDREHRLRQDLISGDRRGARRYAISLSLKWKLVRRRKVLDTGEGWTLDISSSGMQLETGKSLPVGFRLELSIAWPVLLHSTSPLQLTVSGHVTRSIDGLTAIRMSSHEFRTVATEKRRAMAARAGIGATAFAVLGSTVPPRTIN